MSNPGRMGRNVGRSAMKSKFPALAQFSGRRLLQWRNRARGGGTNLFLPWLHRAKLGGFLVPKIPPRETRRGRRGEVSGDGLGGPGFSPGTGGFFFFLNFFFPPASGKETVYIFIFLLK